MPVAGREAPLAAFVDERSVYLDLEVADAVALLREIAARLATRIPGASAHALESGFVNRESLGSTGIGGGVAIPHCRAASLAGPLLGIATLRHALDFGAPDGLPVNLIFAVVSPTRAPGSHLVLLAAIARWAKDPANLERLGGARTVGDAVAALGRARGQVA